MWELILLKFKVKFLICTEFYLLLRKIMYISNNNYRIVYCEKRACVTNMYDTV